ncbi:hypothetical protein HPP92_026260 [Vanilla planifolia]|uniref:Uncharacterized protein n=1 Tax=Vanilla planifolia TaxID=51239 RepID=A0A835PFI6_VANPL|nr:hypothetical protein HPP92_026260 [Vanilla planifolia]
MSAVANSASYLKGNEFDEVVPKSTTIGVHDDSSKMRYPLMERRSHNNKKRIMACTSCLYVEFDTLFV